MPAKDRCRRCGGPMLTTRDGASCLYCGSVTYDPTKKIVTEIDAGLWGANATLREFEPGGRITVSRSRRAGVERHSVKHSTEV